MIVAYPVLMLVALGYAFGVMTRGPASMVGWLYAFGSVAFVAWALVTLARHDTMKAATDLGDAWIRRINQHRQSAQPSVLAAK
jgi:hypothetical protein